MPDPAGEHEGQDVVGGRAADANWNRYPLTAVRLLQVSLAYSGDRVSGRSGEPDRHLGSRLTFSREAGLFERVSALARGLGNR
jgi:hypothetical protein